MVETQLSGKKRDTLWSGSVDARRDEATLRSEEENARKGGEKRLRPKRRTRKGEKRLRPHVEEWRNGGKKTTASAEDGEVAVEWRIGPTQYLPSTLKFDDPFHITFLFWLLLQLCVAQ